MNCAEAFECLPFLDRDDLESVERSEVLRHADACPACFEELEAVRSTVALLREGTSDLLSDPPTAGELAEMFEGVPRLTSRRRGLLVAAATILVMAAGALAIFLSIGDGEEEPGVGPVVQQDPVPVPPEEKKKPETDIPPAPVLEEEKKPAPPKEEVEFSLELRMKAAMHLKRTREWAMAAEAFEKIMRRCRTDEEIKKFGIPALMSAGECNYRQERFLEAYAVYDRVVTKYGEKHADQAADAAYYRYRSAAARHAATHAPTDQKRKDAARDAFWKQFPTHPRAVDLGYYMGADAIHSGDALAGAGHADEAAKRYRVAVDGYLAKVTDGSTLFLKARARVGEALFKQRRYDEALATFRRVLDREKRSKTTDPMRRAYRTQAEAIALYFGALCHEKKGEWGKVLASLEGFERLGDDREVRLFRTPVVRKRSEALAALGRRAEAIAAIESIEKPLAEDLARKGLLLEAEGELARAETALAAAVKKREAQIENPPERVIRDSNDYRELKMWREALERVRAARKR